MIVHSRIGFTVILTLIQTTIAEINGKYNGKEPEINIYNTQTKLTFAKLLKSIVKVNENRFNAMKKLTQLQDVNVARDVLRTFDNRLELGPALGNNSNKILAVVVIKPDESSEESSEEFSETDYDQAPEPNRLTKEYFNLENIEDYPNYSEEDHFHVGRDHSDILKDVYGCRSFLLCTNACAVAFRSVCRECKQVKTRCESACRSYCKRVLN